MELEDVEMYNSNVSYDYNGTYNGTFENCPNINLPVVYVVTQVNIIFFFAFTKQVDWPR